MTTRQIATNQSAVACDVCGRTLLRGEEPAVFLAGGARRNVCELCTPRAAHEGWIREGVGDEALSAHQRGRDRGGSIFKRLRGGRNGHARRRAPVEADGSAEPQLVEAPPPEPGAAPPPPRPRGPPPPGPGARPPRRARLRAAARAAPRPRGADQCRHEAPARRRRL